MRRRRSWRTSSTAPSPSTTGTATSPTPGAPDSSHRPLVVDFTAMTNRTCRFCFTSVFRGLNQVLLLVLKGELKTIPRSEIIGDLPRQLRIRSSAIVVWGHWQVPRECCCCEVVQDWTESYEGVDGVDDAPSRDTEMRVRTALGARK